MSSQSAPIARQAGRAIVLGTDDRVLMIRGVDPATPRSPGFWFTPGGGVEGGESRADAARRELHEEIGLVVDDLGPVVMERVSRFRLEGVWYEQEESIHLVRAPGGFEPAPVHLEGVELAIITEMRWLSLAEIESLDEMFYPRQLVELVRHVAAVGAPDPPWREVTDGQ